MRGRFILSEVGKGLSRNIAMFASIVLVTFVSLFFTGIFSLGKMQVEAMKSQWYDKIEVSIYMCAADDTAPSCAGTEATAEQIEAVKQKLESAELAPFVKESYMESKEEAFENFQRLYANSPLAQFSNPDWLQISFRVKLVDPNQYRLLEEEFAGAPGVAQVQDQRQIVEPLLKVIDGAMLFSGVLAVVMGVAALLLMTTTIRLSAQARERETTIMRYVGASSITILLPFMIEGAIAALSGGLLAVGALWLSLRYIHDTYVTDSFTWSYLVGASEMWIVAPIMLLIAITIAALASLATLAKFTRA
ncbi:permease-like cell division protein FtsX [Gleimia sp. 6138-11-ORH1]|uniref:permease-like cell division protein FtsX n=1 Tax=Gleimia sp. 6138-11-ORH1 TaxID=2973937 RepID=UPI002168E37C|nr:permease-like cell division protein FtsX [Gleimia sp. 6138-11-ORH1]MCS4483991.1 permease-like cell division protein FtsX [Gleimia sp. 6138-11-ORH1]